MLGGMNGAVGVTKECTYQIGYGCLSQVHLEELSNFVKKTKED